MKFLILTLVLLVGGLAGGEDSYTTLDPVWTTGELRWINPPELEAQFKVLEKRLEALETRAKKIDTWGTSEMVCDPPTINLCDGPDCWCGVIMGYEEIPND